MYLEPSRDNKRSTEVAEVQRMLNSVRINFHHSWNYLSEDGIYWKETAAVVRQFQIYRGISSQMSKDGPILGDTTIMALKDYYSQIPIIKNAPNKVQSNNKKRTTLGEVSKASFDLMTFLTGEGMPFYRKIQEAFPIAFKKLSSMADAPNFVFSKTEAYHNKFGARYTRVDIPENVSKYLGNIGLMWSWLTLKNEVDEYKRHVEKNGYFTSETVKMGASVYSLLTSSVDFYLSSPTFKTLAAKISGRYAVAELGASISLTGAAALSTIGQCIGAFMLGWTVGDLIGRIPIGNGLCLQDLIDQYIDFAWEHPYLALGPTSMAIIIDSVKKIIDVKVNMVSNLKPLTPAEKKWLEEYSMRNREMVMYAAPPKLIIKAG